MPTTAVFLLNVYSIYIHFLYFFLSQWAVVIILNFINYKRLAVVDVNVMITFRKIYLNVLKH